MRYKTMRKLFEGLAPSKHRYEVFRDFVEIFALSIRNRADREGWQEREDRYLEVIKPYTRDELTKFAELFAHVTEQMTESPEDVLGKLYMEMEISSDSMGQFFTPYDMARLIAAMSISEVEARARERFATVYEPACGAGAFLIAICSQLKDAGINYQQRLHITADDLSPVSVWMTYIHLTLLHVPAVVYHRNTLTMETWDAWRTPAHVIGLWEYRLKDAPEPLETPTVADWEDVFGEVA